MRLRTGFTVPAGGQPALPTEHDPLLELLTVTELAQALLRLAGALAFFVPAGEALCSREQVDAAISRKVGVGPPPIELWSNLRGVGLGPGAPLADPSSGPGAPSDALKWVVVDVVGMAQLGVPDQEALFAEGHEDAGAVGPLLRSASVHLLARKPIAPGSTSDDPGGRRWRAAPADAVLAPKRRVVRWLPEGSPKPGDAVLRTER